MTHIRCTNYILYLKLISDEAFILDIIRHQRLLLEKIMKSPTPEDDNVCTEC